MNQASRVSTPAGNQKIVFVTQRPPQQNQSMQQNIPQQQNTVVKIMSNTGNVVSQPKILPVQQKMVMVSNTNTGSIVAQNAQVGKNFFTSFLGNLVSQGSNIISSAGGMVQQSHQQLGSVLSKPNFVQQSQKIIKQEVPTSIDDISHLP